MFAVDLHTHTCLSPCAELDMHPAGIVEAAVAAGLDAVAVCDHNSGENIAAVQRAGRAAGLAVVPGMEITSEEEVHILGLFPDLESALAMQSRIYRSLPGRNNPDIFGMQVVADEHAQVLGFNEYLLSGATTLTLEKVVSSVHELHGLAVASHVDRERFGIIGQLGLIPSGLELDGIEISRRTSLPAARAAYAPNGEYPILCSSDAHEAKDVGNALTYMFLEEATATEILSALTGRGGGTILGGGRPMEDLALHVLDIARNSLDAGATRLEIELVEDPVSDTFFIGIRDNGPGMDSLTLAQATDPFFTTRTTRRVGLGLSLLFQAARAAGGGLTIESTPGAGTYIKATFQHSHVDRAPLGDIETTVSVLMAGQPDLGLRFKHRIGECEYEIDTAEVRAALDGKAAGSMEGLALLREAIRQGEARLLKA